MRIVATDVDRTHTTIRLVSAHFEETNKPANTTAHSRDRVQPTYPRSMIQARVSGTVYVLVRVGRDGHVLDAAAEQVNLHQFQSKSQQAVSRTALAKASVDAIKQWVFDTPTEGSAATAPFWYVRVPVTFHLHEIGNPSFDSHTGEDYGTWEVYLRGPRETIPWLQDSRMLAEAPDAMPDGSEHQLGSDNLLAAPLAPN